MIELREENPVKPTYALAAVALVTSAFTVPHAAQAQDGVKRTNLQRQDLSAPGREVVQVLVEFASGASFPRHTHPGEEVVYVVAGSLEYAVEGSPPVSLDAGEVLFIPAGAAHAVSNVGNGTGSELATYIVEKGKPLIILSRTVSKEAT